MKKTLIFAITVLSMVACKKEGHMYKCSYKTPGDHFYTATNYFFREEKDSVAAVNWYRQTEAYASIITQCDTMWIEYWGTYEEWCDIGKNGK